MNFVKELSFVLTCVLFLLFTSKAAESADMSNSERTQPINSKLTEADISLNNSSPVYYRVSKRVTQRRLLIEKLFLLNQKKRFKKIDRSDEKIRNFMEFIHAQLTIINEQLKVLKEMEMKPYLADNPHSL